MRPAWQALLLLSQTICKELFSSSRCLGFRLSLLSVLPFPGFFSAVSLTIGAEVMGSGNDRGCALLTAVCNKRHPCPIDQLGSC